MEALKLYIPAGNWVVETITDFCAFNNIGNAEITGMGSILNIWVMVHPAGTSVVKNFNSSSYEMTSLLGNVTLRQGKAGFDRTHMDKGVYPQFDTSEQALNPYAHLHVTFANPDMTISGGHLLDAQASIGAEIVVRPMAEQQCMPGIIMGNVPPDCVYSAPVTVEPFGTFWNWDERFWFPAQSTASDEKAEN